MHPDITALNLQYPQNMQYSCINVLYSPYQHTDALDMQFAQGEALNRQYQYTKPLNM